jgi:Heavy-metal resistance protein CzcE
MSTVMGRFMAVVGLVLLSLGTSAFAAAPNNGTAGDPNVFNRTIIIRPQTTVVNVVQDEEIRFVNQTSRKSFVWKFNTGGMARFSLNSVAPAGTLDQEITVYVCERVRCD